ncbi:MAG: hypothetical protein HRU46_05300 [Verrucomicrobiales bacterium]|nr:hypothetical protein [Verrucomicrobiales bacterium]
MRGRYSAAVGLTWNLWHAAAPSLGLLLYENAPDVLWYGSLVAGCASALMLLKLVKGER